jgi:hypothetical protein
MNDVQLIINREKGFSLISRSKLRVSSHLRHVTVCKFDSESVSEISGNFY